ncbi:MAG: undecaprenyl-diphosphate phosphatase [Magnetococcales bacterium]|nr:undecaprenyl-diphosphate phosphatase [Magnetococcales bacterium]
MDIWQIITLSVTQGITEFLPISSSAHLVLVPKLTSWPDQGVLFDLGVHVGTLFAVMIYFRKEVFTLLKGFKNFLLGRFAESDTKLFLLLVTSTVPLLIFAPFLKGWVEHAGRSLVVVATTSIVYGLLLYWADKRVLYCENKQKILYQKGAFVYGIFQVLALIPGTSRSGICMTAGRLMGFSREESSRYAMLMSIPVILILGVYGFYEYLTVEGQPVGSLSNLALGAVLSGITAFVAIHALMRFVEKVGFLPFVIYRVLLGFGLLAFVYL